MKPDTIAIDSAGRLVLPKAVRERLPLVPGAPLSIEVREEHLELHPVDNQPALVERDGWWVHLDRGSTDAPLKDTVSRQREDRLRRISS